MTRSTIYGKGSPGAAFYDWFHLPGTVPAIDHDIEYFLAEARRARGPVLELGCGTGRVAIPLTQAGIDVTGLDISPAMLRQAREQAHGLKARFVKGDMKRFNLGRKFRLIYIPFRAFQSLLDPAEQRACLACIHRHLVPGGRLIMDLFDPKLEFCVHGKSQVISRYRKAVDPATGNVCRVVVKERVNDAVQQRLTEKWHFVVRDRRGRLLAKDDRVLCIRWTYRWEMAHLLELCGFEAEACHGDFRRGPARYGAEQIWVARKRPKS